MSCPPFPRTGPRRRRPLADATLDDVALAIPPLRARIDELETTLVVLKRLYDQARVTGALGAARIADLAPLLIRMPS